MADPAEVAIEAALIARAEAFAEAQSLTISLPNVAFEPPGPAPGVKWLRATFLPAASAETGISWNSHVQHVGLLQIDIFGNQGDGEPALGRIASAAIQFFPRGLRLSRDGIALLINRAPYRSSMLRDDPWMQIPVSIPYLCFARP